MDIKSSPLDAVLREVMELRGEGDLFSEIPEGLTSSLAAIPDASRTLRRPAEALRRRSAPRETVTVKVLARPGHMEAMVVQITDIGVLVRSAGPQVLLADVPVAALETLSALDGVARVEAPRRYYHRMDLARADISGVQVAWDQDSNLRGEGVVVGIVDSGVDWRHPDFRHANGDTRLEMLIHAREGEDTMTCLCDTYTVTQINDALLGNTGTVPHGDPHGHGTHCASIAAGNGLAETDTRYAGVAPEATLMGARLDNLSDVNIIDSIRRIFAAAGDRPAVVNLSLGSHYGAHDGTSAIENVIAKETGPGRIVVVAAGNEAQDRIHFEGQLVENGHLDVDFTIRDELQQFDIWIPRGDRLTDLTLIDPFDNATSFADGIYETPAGAFRADLNIDPVNGDQNIVLVLAAGSLGRRWKLRISAGKVLNGEIHAWAATLRDPNASRDGIFMFQRSSDYTLGMPGTAERAIVVGALTSRESVLPSGVVRPDLTSGAVAPFSSRGPSRIGLQRPDIAAPGQWIVAALASDSLFSASDDFASRRLPGGRYISSQGTSMATPFVTGVIALMLQKEPELTPEDIRLRLRATATRDAQTSAVWNTGFGYGKINVPALLRYADALPGSSGAQVAASDGGG